VSRQATLVLLLLPIRYENTERRKAKVEALGLRYMGMGVSGGEEGARRGARF
jgi:6-phosphogluconate dehydrogenase